VVGGEDGFQLWFLGCGLRANHFVQLLVVELVGALVQHQ